MSNTPLTFTVSTRHSERRNSKMRIYLWGESVDNLGLPRRGVYELNPTERRELALAALRRWSGNPKLNDKLRWSRTAGCRCGCSPAFIVEGSYVGRDLHVEFKPAIKVVVDDGFTD